MKISGDDFILLGLCFTVAGALILSRGNIFKDTSAIKDEATMIYGANPFLIKKGIVQKWEHIFGVILIVPAIILQLIGIYLNKTKPRIESVFFNPWYNLIPLLLFTICILWISYLLSNSFAKQKYTLSLKISQTEGLSQTEYVLQNDGLYGKEQGQAQNINRETRDKRLSQMQGRLKMWERLFNFKRKSNESDIDYFLRLKAHLNE